MRMAKDTKIDVRVPTALKAELERRAAADERTLSAYVLRIICDHVGQRPAARKSKK